MKKIIPVVLLVVLSACGQQSVGNSAIKSPAAAATEKTAFEKMEGNWTVRLTSSISTCFNDFRTPGDWHIRNHLVREGAFRYIHLEMLDYPGEGHLRYEVTTNDDPFTMSRVWDDRGSRCVWQWERRYDLSFIDLDHLIGTQTSTLSSNNSFCEQCYFVMRYEATRGLYNTIDDLTPWSPPATVVPITRSARVEQF